MNVKHRISTLFALCAHVLHIDCVLLRRKRHYIPMVGFHSVNNNPTPGTQHLCFSTTEFEKRIAYIAKNYQTLHFEELKTVTTVKKPSALIYFDDGFLDNIEVAFTLLQKYNVKATML